MKIVFRVDPKSHLRGNLKIWCHGEYFSLGFWPNSLTHSCLVNFIDVTLACEDANSKLVDVVSVADDGCVGNNLLQIRKLRFGQKAKLVFRLWAQGLVKKFKLKFRQDLKLEFGQFFLLMFCRGYLNLGRNSEAILTLVEMFEILKLIPLRDSEV